FLDILDSLNLTPAQQKLLAEIPDVLFRQSVRDYMVNQHFRKDYWVKGARTLTPLEQQEAMRRQRVLLVTHRPDVNLTINGALGAANMQTAIYGPVLDFLADHKVRSIAEIEQAVAKDKLNYHQVREA